MRGIIAIVAIAIGLGFGAPADAEGQSVLKRIKDNTKQKITERKTQTKDRIVEASAEPVDSALSKTAQPVDSVIAKSASGAAAAVSRTASGIGAALGDRSASADRIAEQLATGRVVLHEITFHPGTAMLDPDAEPALVALADAFTRIDGTFLIEGHVAPDAGDAAALQPLSTARAVAVKEWLASSGIDPARLVALGVGASRSAEDSTRDRIEVAVVR